jgi:beta-ureidopropionase / N-carbamoyl-L-amino-acid hydrolase
MSIKNFILVSAVLVSCFFATRLAAAQGPSELNVLSSNLSRPAISELIPMFERLHKIKVKVQYANNPILKQQIEAGAKFDVVIVEPQMLAELARAGFVDHNSITDLAKVGMALVSKKGSPAVDVSSVESFKKVLLSARSISYTADGHSGSVFLATLAKIQLTDQMKPTLMPVVGRFSTVSVAEGSAQYTAFPGVGLDPGVQIAGMFPEEIQTYIGITAGISQKAEESRSARRFLEYLQSEPTMAHFKSLGYTPLALAKSGLRIEKEPMQSLVNGGRLNASLRQLAEFGKTPEGGTNRVAYSEEDVRARDYVMRLMREAELDVSVDAAGNIVGRRAGSNPSFKPIMIGSHIDSVPMGGQYDGQVGSMGAIEVARTLAERKIVLQHPLIVVIFQNEEGGTTGSNAMAHGLKPEDLESVSNSKKTIREGIRFIGGDPDKLSSPLLKKGDLAGYLELHIEQGGRLDQQKINIGVVEGIVGLRWFEITINGFANHAGTTPMGQRQDALLAAAKYIEAVNRAARSINGPQVATVGKIQAFPGATNVVPGKVVTSLDVRDLDPAKIAQVLDKIRESVKLIEAETGTKFEFKETASSNPALADQAFKEAIDASAKALGFITLSLPSGAGHDAQEIADICPVGMIFVPSRSGISHSPKEFTEPTDITNGANVLLQSLVRLDSRLAK